MTKETNPYDIDLTDSTPELVDEIRQSLRRRELIAAGMSEQELTALDARINSADGYSAMERAVLTAARAKAKAKAEAAEARYMKAQQIRWDVFSGTRVPAPAPNAQPYWADLKRLRRLAADAPPQFVQHTVTSYCRWVHTLYDRGSDRERAQAYGKYIERSVAKMPKLRGHPDWEEIYHDPLSKKPTPMRLSALTIHGKPLWGAPDYVYQHRRTNEVVIVERKASEARIPLDGWPDLRAQLWCYAQIDQWKDAPAIRLVAEVWREDSQGLTLRTTEGGVMRWVRDDPGFHETNEELFTIYQTLCERIAAAHHT